MDKETIVEIAETLKELLGPTFEHIYEAAYRSAIASSIGWLIFGVTLLAATGIAVRAMLRHAKENEHNDFFDYIGGLFLLIPFLIGLLCTLFAVTDLIALDWVTLRKMVSLVGVS